jgi:hypothetical protein
MPAILLNFAPIFSLYIFLSPSDSHSRYFFLFLFHFSLSSCMQSNSSSGLDGVVAPLFVRQRHPRSKKKSLTNWTSQKGKASLREKKEPQHARGSRSSRDATPSPDTRSTLGKVRNFLCGFLCITRKLKLLFPFKMRQFRFFATATRERKIERSIFA